MRRSALINDLINETGYSYRGINKFLYAFVKVLAENIKKGEVVSLTKLGSFRAKSYKSHKGRNMRTGEWIILPESKKVSFHPTEYLRTFINSDTEKEKK